MDSKMLSDTFFTFSIKIGSVPGSVFCWSNTTVTPLIGCPFEFTTLIIPIVSFSFVQDVKTVETKRKANNIDDILRVVFFMIY